MKITDVQRTALQLANSCPTTGKAIDRPPMVRFATALALEKRGLVTLELGTSRGPVIVITDKGKQALEA